MGILRQNDSCRIWRSHTLEISKPSGTLKVIAQF